MARTLIMYTSSSFLQRMRSSANMSHRGDVAYDRRRTLSCKGKGAGGILESMHNAAQAIRCSGQRTFCRVGRPVFTTFSGSDRSSGLKPTSFRCFASLSHSFRESGLDRVRLLPAGQSANARRKPTSVVSL